MCSNEKLLASLFFSFIATPIILKLASFPGDVIVKPGHLHEEQRLLKNHVYLNVGDTVRFRFRSCALNLKNKTYPSLIIKHTQYLTHLLRASIVHLEL